VGTHNKRNSVNPESDVMIYLHNKVREHDWEKAHPDERRRNEVAENKIVRTFVFVEKTHEYFYKCTMKLAFRNSLHK
jgi:hypothetical protein